MAFSARAGKECLLLDEGAVRSAYLLTKVPAKVSKLIVATIRLAGLAEKLDSGNVERKLP